MCRPGSENPHRCKRNNFTKLLDYQDLANFGKRGGNDKILIPPRVGQGSSSLVKKHYLPKISFLSSLEELLSFVQGCCWWWVLLKYAIKLPLFWVEVGL